MSSVSNAVSERRAIAPQIAKVDRRKHETRTERRTRAGAIAALVRRPGWDRVLARSMEAQATQSASFAEQLGYVTPDVDTLAARSTDTLLRGWEADIPEAERKRVSFYFTLGTHNQDPRGMMLDGEATFVVSGLPAAAGLVDLYYLMARTTWVNSKPELDRLLPEPTDFWRRMAKLARAAL